MTNLSVTYITVVVVAVRIVTGCRGFEELTLGMLA